MRMILVLALAVVMGIHWPQDMQLVTKQITGTVVDANGRPVADAEISYTDSRVPEKTDGQGRFAVTTKSPAIVFHKAGTHSYLLRTADASDVRVVLQPLEQPAMAVCRSLRKRKSLKKTMWAELWFPMVNGVRATPQGSDVDYVQRSYIVSTKTGQVGISHGSGAMWGSGRPLASDVWDSVSYEEKTFMVGSQLITDARGVTADGKKWRSLGKAFESASYRGLGSDAAQILDKVLDGACLQPSRMLSR